MTHFRRPLFVALTLLGASLSVGCHLGITNRPALFPSIAYSPNYARAGGYGGGGYGCGPAGCYREFGPNAGCGGSLYAGRGPVYGYGYGAPTYGAGPAVSGPVVSGPVCDAPVTMMPSYGGYDLPVSSGGFSTPIYSGGSVPIYSGGYSSPAPAPSPGCTGCAANSGGVSGIPIAGTVGGPPIAVSPVGGMSSGPIYGAPLVAPGGGPVHGVPFDTGAVPTLKPPPGSVPLQMPSEVKEAKKISIAGK